MAKFDIDINDASNGVFLPTQKGVSESAYHPSLHTDLYYSKVEDLLSGAKNKEEAINILKKIAQQLKVGTFEY